MNYKKYIAIKVSSYLNLSIEKIENSIVTPSDIKNGDYSLLCFKLNEKLNKSPAEVSSYLKLKKRQRLIKYSDKCVLSSVQCVQPGYFFLLSHLAQYHVNY